MDKVARRLPGIYAQRTIPQHGWAFRPLASQYRGFSSEKRSYDVVVAGGGVVGSSTAYFLKKALGKDCSVLVLEKDSSYQRCSTVLSAGGIRQQFSTPENVALSLFALDFLRNVNDNLAVGEDMVDVNLREQGYLLLASEAGLPILKSNHKVQTEGGANIVLETPEEMQKRFPWLNTDGVSLGAFGATGEGWFDAYSLLIGLRKKAVSLGAVYKDAEVEGIRCDGDKITAITTSEGEEISCGTFVNAAGSQGGNVAALAGVHLPVEARKRFVFVFQCRSDEVSNAPLLVDPNGVYFRPESSGMFICGMSPEEENDGPHGKDDFEVDYSVFDEFIWPTLANRVPAFEGIKLQNAWAGHYDFNTFDQNAVVGKHLSVKNMLFGNGFSGHGLQHALGVGRGLSELIAHQQYTTLNLDCFSYDRLVRNDPLYEKCVV